VNIIYADKNDFFLRCTGNENARGWGTVGKNGADCIFTANNQDMIGDVVYDSVSNLDFYMVNGSSLQGAFIDDESCAGDGGRGYCNLYISPDSTWTVTGDSVVSAIYSTGSIIDENSDTVSLVSPRGTIYVRGNSSYTVTVGSYSTLDKSPEASKLDSYDSYVVDRP
jgi:hypothetical protein